MKVKLAFRKEKPILAAPFFISFQEMCYQSPQEQASKSNVSENTAVSPVLCIWRGAVKFIGLENDLRRTGPSNASSRTESTSPSMWPCASPLPLGSSWLLVSLESISSSDTKSMSSIFLPTFDFSRHLLGQWPYGMVLHCRKWEVEKDRHLCYWL